MRIRSPEGKTFPNGVGRVILALAHGNAEIKNPYRVLGYLAQGIKLVFGLHLFKKRPNIRWFDFINAHGPQRRDDMFDDALFLAVIGALLPPLAYIFQPLKSNGFHAQGMGLPPGDTLFFLDGLLDKTFFFLTLKSRIDALGDLLPQQKIFLPCLFQAHHGILAKREHLFLALKGVPRPPAFACLGDFQIEAVAIRKADCLQLAVLLVGPGLCRLLAFGWVTFGA